MFKKGLALLTAVLMIVSASSAFAQIQQNTNGVYFSDDFEDTTASGGYWVLKKQVDNNNSIISAGDAFYFEDGKIKLKAVESGFIRRFTKDAIFPAGSYTLDFDLPDLEFYNQWDPFFAIDFNHKPSNPSNYHQLKITPNGSNFELTLSQRYGSTWEEATVKPLVNSIIVPADSIHHLCIVYDNARSITVYNIADGVRTEIIKATDADGVRDTGGRGLDINAKLCQWTIDNFVIKEGLPAAPAVEDYSTSALVETENGVKEGTIRFAYQVDGYGVTGAGACIVPVSVFDSDAQKYDNGLKSAAEVNIADTAIGDGKTFGADLTNIPETNFDTAIYSKPFIKVGEDTIWGSSLTQASVNSALNTNAN